jgi:hypothetical protein
MNAVEKEMTDYDKLKDVFEIAEVLSNEFQDTLEVIAVSETTNKAMNVVFSFNKQRELVEVYIEE